MNFNNIENEEYVDPSIIPDYHLEEFENKEESQERKDWFSTEE